MKRGTTRPLIKPFPKVKQHTWKQQQLFIKLNNSRQEDSEPFRFGSVNTLYGTATYTSR
jgi:hypothetical protein